MSGFSRAASSWWPWRLRSPVQSRATSVEETAARAKVFQARHLRALVEGKACTPSSWTARYRPHFSPRPPGAVLERPRSSWRTRPWVCSTISSATRTASRALVHALDRTVAGSFSWATSQRVEQYHRRSPLPNFNTTWSPLYAQMLVSASPRRSEWRLDDSGE